MKRRILLKDKDFLSTIISHLNLSFCSCTIRIWFCKQSLLSLCLSHWIHDFSGVSIRHIMFLYSICKKFPVAFFIRFLMWVAPIGLWHIEQFSNTFRCALFWWSLRLPLVVHFLSQSPHKYKFWFWLCKFCICKFIKHFWQSSHDTGYYVNFLLMCSYGHMRHK